MILILQKRNNQKKKSFYFISKYFSETEKLSFEIQNYFAFIAAMILSIKWEKVAFLTDSDAFVNNYHLIPYAFELLVDITPSIFEKASSENVKDGVTSFFTVLANNYEKNTKKTGGRTCTADGRSA